MYSRRLQQLRRTAHERRTHEARRRARAHAELHQQVTLMRAHVR